MGHTWVNGDGFQQALSLPLCVHFSDKINFGYSVSEAYFRSCHVN